MSDPKYDQVPHVEWQARLVRYDAEAAVTLAAPGTTVLHHTRGLHIPQDHYCLSLFPRGAWYNAMLDFDHTGKSLGVYCNVAMPYEWASGCLTWVDLDLDVIMEPGRPAVLVDADEFVTNARRYGYPAGIVERAHAAATELLGRASRAVVPFASWDLADALQQCAPMTAEPGSPIAE